MPIPRDYGPTRHSPHRQCPRSPRLASVWPCATASHREGTGLIADWLPSAVTQIVTTYTQPHDHVLLHIPPGHLDAVAERPALGSKGLRGNGAFAGLAEAAWAVARLCRIIHPESDAWTDTKAPERYHVVITAVDPRARRPAPTLDWTDLLHPHGILAVITHSDSSTGRLIDPTGDVVHAARHAGLTYLDHIALLEVPLRHGPLDTNPPPRGNRRATRAIRVHSDLLIFSRIPGAGIRADHKETPMPEHTPRVPPVAAWSVWPTGQHDQTTHHTRGYLPATRTDAERIPPALAAYAISAYSHPGDTVLDPDCGAGTVLVEALHAGRHTVGLTTSRRWWNIARANLTATKRAGAWPDASVLDAHPRMLTTPRAAGLTGHVHLMLTTLRHHPTGHADPHEAGPGLSRLAQTLTACIPLLRPDAHVIITIRRHRHREVLQDLPSAVLAAGHTAGLIPLQRCVALTTPLRGILLTHAAPHKPRASIPISLTAHHDVLIFRTPKHTEQRAAGIPTLATPTPIRRPTQHLGANGCDGSRQAV